MTISSIKLVKTFAFLILILQLWTTQVSSRSTNMRMTATKDRDASFVTKSIVSSNSSEPSKTSSEDNPEKSSESDEESSANDQDNHERSEESKISEPVYEEVVKTIKTKYAHSNPAVLMHSSSSQSGQGEDETGSSAQDQASSEDDMKGTIDQVSDATTSIGNNISTAIKSTVNKVGQALKNATDTATEAVRTAIIFPVVRIKNGKGKRSLRYSTYSQLQPISFADSEAQGTEATDETTTEGAEDNAESISTATENITAQGGVIGHGKVDEESSSEKTIKEPNPKDKEEPKQSKTNSTTSTSTKQEPKGSATLESAAAYPAFPIKSKPGICRPLTKGLACIALAPDASQCSTDNGCPGSKKCCFYGCPPYTNTGICEFPVLNGY